MTFDDVYRRLKLKPSTAKKLSASYHFVEQIKNMRMVDIKSYHLESVAEQTKGMSKSTQTALKELVHTVFKWAVERDICFKDYSQFMVFPETGGEREKSALSKADIKTVLDKGEDALVALLYTGMRVNELLAIKTENVHFGEHDYFEITKAKTPSGIRKVPIHPAIKEMVKAKMGGEYLFDFAYTALYQRYRKWRKCLEMPHSIHDFRRTFATYAKSCGMDDYYRRAILGHSQKGITDKVYTDALLPDMCREMEKLSYQ